MIKLETAASSINRELLPPLAMIGGVAFSALIFLSSTSYTLDQVAAAARASSVEPTLRMSYASELAVVEAHRLDVARSTPVVVDMVGKLASGQLISVSGSHTHTVAVESLRVRGAPSKSSRQVGALSGGAKVTVTDERNGWQYVTAGDGTKGWVYRTFLRPVT